MEDFVKNNFCEIIAAAEAMWHERKGFDTAQNKRSMKTHFNAIKKELDRIKKNIELLEAQEFKWLQECINN